MLMLVPQGAFYMMLVTIIFGIQNPQFSLNNMFMSNEALSI